MSTYWIMGCLMRHHREGQMSFFKQDSWFLLEGNYVSHCSSDAQCSQGWKVNILMSLMLNPELLSQTSNKYLTKFLKGHKQYPVVPTDKIYLFISFIWKLHIWVCVDGIIFLLFSTNREKNTILSSLKSRAISS